MSDVIRVRCALLSVSDKTGIEAFARSLAERGVKLIATGETCACLRKAGLEVTEVAELTGFPAMMGGRVKTLHPKVHGGLLGREDGEGGGPDVAAMAAHDIAPIDLLGVNLYPFETVVADESCDLARAVEYIDAGGPALIRSSAKNHARVTVITDPGDYDVVIDALDAHGGVPLALRYNLAVAAFSRTAAYDSAIANWLGARNAAGDETDQLPARLHRAWKDGEVLRYGENPHQRAIFYRDWPGLTGTVGAAKQISGKVLSYNNIADTDAALTCVFAFEAPACVIVKHANPCGVAIAEDLSTAYDRAFRSDPTSAFGGIIACNRELDAATATAIVERQFVEVIVAPEVAPGARTVVAKKGNVRLLTCGMPASAAGRRLVYRQVGGGLLVQDLDCPGIDAEALRLVTQRAPDERELTDLHFAWIVAQYVKSNAIVYAREGATVGVGAGQTSRVYSARIANLKAADQGQEIAGAVMASDAFFPFRDGIDAAAEAGITAVIQPGGSLRDEEVIAAADEAGIAMLFTGRRHFLH